MATRRQRLDAARALFIATAAGTLPPAASLPCRVCGDPHGVPGRQPGRRTRVVYHHHDYAQPLAVTPLCMGCHRQVHLGTIPDPATGQPTADPIVSWFSTQRGRAYLTRDRSLRP